MKIQSWLYALPRAKTALNCVVVAAVICFLLVLAVLALPVGDSEGKAHRRSSCGLNIRQLAIALTDYEQAYKSLPPAYTVDANGNRLHSWRTLILPYLDESETYAQIDLSKPWNDPIHDKVRAQFLINYRCPSIEKSNRTAYLALVGPNCVFNTEVPTTFAEITDGPAVTIMLVETSSKLEIEWMEPRDISPEDFYKYLMSPKAAFVHHGGTHIVTADVSPKFVSDGVDPRILKAMMTKNASDSTNLESSK
jgi:hypothetical protein